MTNIVRIVGKYLDKQPCIQRDMRRGLINTRALSKYIIKQQALDVKLDAVVSAIRRYDMGRAEDIFENAFQMIIETNILSTRSSLAEFSLFKDRSVQEILPKTFHILNHTRGDVIRIIQANETIKVLVDERNFLQIKELFPEEKIEKIVHNLAEINMNIHKDFQQTPGVLAAVANELAIHGINIIECITCPPELLWFVDESDVLRAYDVINQLCETKNSRS